jgi:hypothetical protein
MGRQPKLPERYISAGSPYLCALEFSPRGVGPEDEFWTCAGMVAEQS